MEDLHLTIIHDHDGITITDRFGKEVKRFTSPAYASFYITNLIAAQAKYLKANPEPVPMTEWADEYNGMYPVEWNSL